MKTLVKNGCVVMVADDYRSHIRFKDSQILSIKKVMKVVLLLLVLIASSTFTAKSQPIVFTYATIIDVKNGDLKSGMSVVITGGRIAAIGKTGKVKIPRNAQVIDASYKFLIPGLWEMHVLLFNNISGDNSNNRDIYFPLLISNGVTGVRDMWTDPDDIKLVRQWQKDFEAGDLLAPRIMFGSRIVDGVPVTHKNSLGVSNASEAREAVQMLQKSGAGFIKIYESLSRESYYAIADEAKRQKISFAGHVPDSITPTEASNAGQKSLEHLTRMLIACSAQEDKFKNLKNQEWTPALRAELMETYSEQKCREVSKQFVKNGTWHTPTAVVLRSRLLSEAESFKTDARLRYVSAGEKQYLLEFAGNFRPANRKIREARFQQDLEILKVMHQAGVPILAGTDVGNPYIFAGFSLHDELELFVQAGFTPLEALQTATINPAKFLGMEKTLGTIEKGKFADMVLLDANPLESISNTKKINAVVLNGKLLDREVLDKMLSEIETTVKQK